MRVYLIDPHQGRVIQIFSSRMTISRQKVLTSDNREPQDVSTNLITPKKWYLFLGDELKSITVYGYIDTSSHVGYSTYADVVVSYIDEAYRSARSVYLGITNNAGAYDTSGNLITGSCLFKDDDGTNYISGFISKYMVDIKPTDEDIPNQYDLTFTFIRGKSITERT